MFNEPKVLIVGAGAAGIAAAARLIEKGLKNVTILEAKDRIGGRIHTTEFSDHYVELGAQWVHGERGNVVFDLAVPRKLLDSSYRLHDFTKYTFATLKGEIIPEEESTEALRIYHEIADNGTENATGSYGEYFTNEYYKIFEQEPFTSRDRAEQFLDWIEKMDNSIQCSDSWFDVSARRLANYWVCEGDSVLNWKTNGYKTLFDLLTRNVTNSQNYLPVLEKIEFNKDVIGVDYTSDNNIIVQTKDGAEYSANHVVVTTSLGVLKERHSRMFVPPLPEVKQLAIKGLTIGTADKIFLEFPQRWWKEDSAGFCLIWSKEEREEFLKTHGKENEWLCDVFMFFTVDYQPRVLCGWIVGKNARHMESLSDSDVSDGMCLLLESFCGKAYNVVKPDRIIRSKWYTDEHFRGSYSFQSMTTEELNVDPKDLAEPITTADGKPLVLFAGEATHEHYYSTVHGAVESGFREADRIVYFHRTRGWLRQVINSYNKLDRILSTEKEVRGRTKIVIVGAGIAGLAAAKTLEDANFKDYLLLEAHKEVGGRIQSIPWKHNWIECGAQFVHGDRSKLAELCYQHDLLLNLHYKDGEGGFLRDNGDAVDQNLVEEVDDLIRTALDECEDYENQNEQTDFESIGSLLRTWYKKHSRRKNDAETIKDIKEEIFDWNVRFLMIDNSCFTLNELSAKFWGKFKFIGGPEHLTFKAGYSSLTNLIANSINERNLRLNTAVDFIEWQDSMSGDLDAPIALTLSDNTRILCDCVIITCSLGYLKVNYDTMFSPQLPSTLRQGIENLGFGLINKIFLDFDSPWWDSNAKGFQLLWSKNSSAFFSDETLAPWTRDLTGFDVIPDHPGILLGWVGGRGAYTVETLSEKEIATDCENLLKYYLKLDNMPVVKKCFRTQWNSDKYIKGGYSHIPTKCDAAGITPATLAEPVWGEIRTENNTVKDVPIIMFAGEATHENYYSTTHGAYDTGVKQAQTFLRHHVGS